MSGTAGFAVVGCVQQDLINSALRVAQANFVPPYTFFLPNVVTVGNTSVSISGTLALVAPQVTLRTRADNLVSVNVGFAGQLSLSTGSQAALTEVLLSAAVLAGLVTQVAKTGNTQQVTVGLNLAVASVTAVDVTVLAGPPLASVFTSTLTAGPVLAALTAALQAVPPELVQVTPQGINLPLQIVQTYQPPKSSLFFPATLFQLQFAISRIVARPLNAASGTSGVLVVAIDMSAPVATTGDANSLTDITSTVPTGPSIEYMDSGTQFVPGGGVAQTTCGVAIYIDSGWVTSMINTVLSPQLGGKFLPQLASNNVSFTEALDCLQVTFGNVTAALNDPLSPPIPTSVPMPGMTLQLKMTRWIGISTDSLGYYHGVSGPGTADVVFSAHVVLLLMQNGRQQQPDPKPPVLTNDYYAAFVIGTDLSLPWWVDVVAILAGGPVYLVGSAIAGLFGVDIFYPTIVANVNNQAGQGLEVALGGLLQQQNTQLVAQLPGTTVPNWYLTIAGLGVSSDVCYTCIDLMPLPGGLGGTPGSFPYVMLTDQPVTNPNAVPDVPGDPFPLRFDGSFNWPGIAYNEQGGGAPGGTCQWDVHDINPVGAVLKIPAGMFSPNDPTIFVSWTVTRTDTNTQLLSQTLSLGRPGALAVSIDHASAALQAADGYQVNCTMFQQLAGGGTQQIFNSGNVYVEIQDHFDRHHPYATWPPHQRPIYPGQPFWNAIPAKEHVRSLRWVKTTRASRIHRTDLWKGGRCCLVAETSGLMGNPPHGKPLYDRAQVPRGIDDFTYLDTLPISLVDVQRDRNLARGILCDYCFFGGPTKIVLRTDFP